MMFAFRKKKTKEIILEIEARKRRKNIIRVPQTNNSQNTRTVDIRK